VAVLLGERPATVAAMTAAARQLASSYGVSFLVKGGHLSGDELTDVLVTPGGQTRTYASRRILGVDTHGSGCTLSAAIAAHLARDWRWRPPSKRRAPTCSTGWSTASGSGSDGLSIIARDS